jgi:hypothetical protein
VAVNEPNLSLPHRCFDTDHEKHLRTIIRVSNNDPEAAQMVYVALKTKTSDFPLEDGDNHRSYRSRERRIRVRAVLYLINRTVLCNRDFAAVTTKTNGSGDGDNADYNSDGDGASDDNDNGGNDNVGTAKSDEYQARSVQVFDLLGMVFDFFPRAAAAWVIRQGGVSFLRGADPILDKAFEEAKSITTVVRSN